MTDTTVNPSNAQQFVTYATPVSFTSTTRRLLILSDGDITTTSASGSVGPYPVVTGMAIDAYLTGLGAGTTVGLKVLALF